LTPVALIIKPLQFIKAESAYTAHDSKGRPYTAFGAEYWMAFAHARNGNGGPVRTIARQLLAA